MIMLAHKKVENVIFDGTKKGCKYGVVKGTDIIYINAGRYKEYNIRSAYGFNTLDLENISHKVAGDIKIDGREYNIKSYKCELKAKGLTIAEKIDNYITSDASQGMIYVIEHNENVIEIRMNWDEVKEFLNTFGKVENDKIRVYTCDSKIYKWATEQA